MRSATAFALALVLVPAALGHGGGGLAAGFQSTVSSLEPPVVGVLVSVLGSDDRLRVVNYSDKTIVVAGYDGEPFLRFTDAGVYENVRSPATYLSRERDPARAVVPASADAGAPPQWRKIAESAESATWHDHRIHWCVATRLTSFASSRTSRNWSSAGAFRRPPTERRLRSRASSATRRRRRSPATQTEG